MGICVALLLHPVDIMFFFFLLLIAPVDIVLLGDIENSKNRKLFLLNLGDIENWKWEIISRY